MRRGQQGFTLIEVLAALVVFSLLVSLLYAVLTPAGEGFKRLRQVRVAYEQSLGAGWRINQDMACLVQPLDGEAPTLAVSNDNRGADAFDELWLVAATEERPGLSRIHYYIDEQRHVLVRESAPLRTRQGHAPLSSRLGRAEAMDIQLLDAQGHWHQRWVKRGDWPRAIRVTIRDGKRKRQWLLPVWLGRAL